MDKPYFIMMYNQNRNLAMPILDGTNDNDDIVKFYKNINDARKAMRNHSAAQAFGYEIFKMGSGE